jgi:hypothetical protein
MFNNNVDLFVTYERITMEPPGITCAAKFTNSGIQYMPRLNGIEINGKFYKWRSYNTFEDEPSLHEGYYKITNSNINYFIGDKKRIQDLIQFPQDGYKIHNNGDIPYIVCIGETVQIYQFPSDCGDHSNDTDYYTQLVLEIVPEKIFIGSDREHEGNSILLKTTQNHYIYIGHTIYEFIAEDEILEYHSLIGNSDMPYPYAVGEKFMYLMIENVFINKIDDDPYYYYYNRPHNIKQKYSSKIKSFEPSAWEIKKINNI